MIRPPASDGVCFPAADGVRPQVSDVVRSRTADGIRSPARTVSGRRTQSSCQRRKGSGVSDGDLAPAVKVWR
ncbi:unnamed protein product [Linum trigynum]|uniref:Uncharacterized protein n=1 Tax=Linum trigynum TaxID=586398 RepID=A0AAV2GSW2_9ROSI